MRRSRATLTILSATLSADELVKAIALTPDGIVERGSPVSGSSGNLHRFSVVSFESHLDPQADPFAHVDELLQRLAPARDAIRALAGSARPAESRDVPVRLSLHVESTHRMLGLDLSAEQLAVIAKLGAHLGVSVDTDLEAADV